MTEVKKEFMGRADNFFLLAPKYRTKKRLNEFFDQALKQQREEIAERMKEVSGNIRRFDDKEKGADYFAGWDNCLDTIEIDFKEFLSDLKGETK